MSDIQDTLRETVEKNRVVLFMKGTKQSPACGFSNAVVQILGGPDAGSIRVISASTNTTQTFTITPQLGVSPAGNQYTVAAFEQAGVGQSTFVTDSGPSVTTFNHFGTVLSDFGTTLFLGGNQLHPSAGIGDFSYTWQTFAPGTFGSPFP